MPPTTTSSRGPAAAVGRAIAGVRPVVTMWRDGLTVIPLASADANRAPDYLTALTDASATPSVGLGHDVRFTAPRLVGTALVHDRRAIHVALFRSAA